MTALVKAPQPYIPCPPPSTNWRTPSQGIAEPSRPVFCTIVHLLTEHALTCEYTARHRSRAPDSHGCPCGTSPLQTPAHVITQCPLFQAARERHLTPITPTLPINIVFDTRAGGAVLVKFIEDDEETQAYVCRGDGASRQRIIAKRPCPRNPPQTTFTFTSHLSTLCFNTLHYRIVPNGAEYVFVSCMYIPLYKCRLKKIIRPQFTTMTKITTTHNPRFRIQDPQFTIHNHNPSRGCIPVLSSLNNTNVSQFKVRTLSRASPRSRANQFLSFFCKVLTLKTIMAKFSARASAEPSPRHRKRTSKKKAAAQCASAAAHHKRTVKLKPRRREEKSSESQLTFVYVGNVSPR
jgi:hypothetical protein